jgi:hypothetical protein
MADEIPDLRPAHDRRIDVGGGVALLFLTDEAGSVGVEHQCSRPRDGQTLLIAPRLTKGPGGHSMSITGGDLRTITVTPSILCPDCGLHGFVTDGAWRTT